MVMLRRHQGRPRCGALLTGIARLELGDGTSFPIGTRNADELS